MPTVQPLKIESGRVERIPTTDSVELATLGVGVSASTHAIEVSPSAADKTGLIVNGYAAQTADLLIVKDNGGTSLFSIEDDGVVSLNDVSSDPSNAAGYGKIYTKDVSSVTELFYLDDTGAAVQITSGGALNAGGAVSGWTDDGSVVRLTTGSDKVVIGGSDTSATPADGNVQGQSGSGTDIAGAALILSGGQSTGSAAGGSITLKVSPAGTTGSSLNALANALVIDSTKLATFSGNISMPDPLVIGGGAHGTSGTSSTVVGQAASAAGEYGVALGKNSAAAASGSVVVGFGSSCQSDSNNSIIVGLNSTVTGVGSTANVILGPNSTASSAGCVVIGGSSTAAGSSAIIVGGSSTGVANAAIVGKSSSTTGANASVLGGQATAASTAVALGFGTNAASLSIALGAYATTAGTRQMSIGSDTAYISNVYLGTGISSEDPRVVTVNATGAIGTDIKASDLILAGGRGTGAQNTLPLNGVGEGRLIFKTAPAGASGSTQNNLVTRLIIDAEGAWLLGGSAGTSGYVLTSNGSGTPPTWQAAGGGSAGFTDDGTTVRLTTATDVVSLGSASAIANTKLSAYASSSTQTPVKVRGASSQSANLFEAQNNSGVALASISSAGDITRSGTSGNTTNVKVAEESITLSSGTYVDATGNGRIPAGATVLYVTTRVTTAISGPASIDVGVAGDVTRYTDNASTSLDATNVCIDNSGFTRQYAAQTAIRVSAGDGSTAFTAGVLKVCIHYLDATAPTS